MLMHVIQSGIHVFKSCGWPPARTFVGAGVGTSDPTRADPALGAAHSEEWLTECQDRNQLQEWAVLS